MGSLLATRIGNTQNGNCTAPQVACCSYSILNKCKILRQHMLTQMISDLRTLKHRIKFALNKNNTSPFSSDCIYQLFSDVQ